MSRKRSDIDYQNPKENEPHLGAWWAVFMLVLIGLKEAFPSEKYSFLWFLQIYIIGICVCVVLFVIYKRRKYDKIVKEQESPEDEES